MKPRICICCGEAMSALSHSRYPNLCASCASLADSGEENHLPPEEPSENFYRLQDAVRKELELREAVAHRRY